MVRPKKHLGQHFLTDLNTAQKIARSLPMSEEDLVLEIGPGKGVLTNFLLEEKINLKVCEIDNESVEYLKEHQNDLAIINADFLKLDLEDVFNGKEFKIIGNFPYNISSQIVFHILDNHPLIPAMAGMFQREVARRITSQPGSKDYGILSVLTQALYDCHYLFTVNEGVFHPPPKVKSGVILIERKEDAMDMDAFLHLKKVVKLAFNQRRKQLRNSLKSILPENFQGEVLGKRPEQLSVKDFQDLAESLRT